MRLLPYLRQAMGSKFDPEAEYGLVTPQTLPAHLAKGHKVVLDKFEWDGEVFTVVEHPKPKPPPAPKPTPKPAPAKAAPAKAAPKTTSTKPTSKPKSRWTRPMKHSKD